MNPRDLPEVVAELIIEMHEVRSELQGLNGRVDRLEQTMAQVVAEQRGMREDMRGLREDMRGLREDMHGLREDMHGLREDMQAMPDRIGTAVIKSLEPFLNRLLDHGDQLKNHESRLGRLEKTQE